MRVIYGLLGLGILGVMLTLGVMFFVVFAAVALVGGSVIAARIWWLSRKAEKHFGDSLGRMREPGPPRPSTPPSDTVIDGEYTVVDSEPKS